MRFLMRQVQVAMLCTLALGAGRASAQIPTKDGPYYACYNRQTGVLRLIDPAMGQRCTPAEAPASWNVVAEATARQKADVQLQANIAAEEVARIGKDAALQQQVDALQAASPCQPGGTCSTTGKTGCAYDRNCSRGETCVWAGAPGTRFSDNGDGTVTDLRTCLTWEKKTGTWEVPSGTSRWCPNGTYCSDASNVNNYYSWMVTAGKMDGSVATDFLARLNTPPGFAGHTDWRLPTTAGTAGNGLTGDDPELESIFSPVPPVPCTSSPCIDSVFGPTASGFYWSANLTSFDPPVYPYALAFLAVSPPVDHLILTCPDSHMAYARAVRGGPGAR